MNIHNFGAIARQSPVSPKGSLKKFIELSLKGELLAGDLCLEFERLFAAKTGHAGAVSFSSARMGLLLTLKAWGAGAGSEVIVPSLTCPIVPGVVVAAGARPIFADSDPDTFNMSFHDIEKKITPRTKAIVATHIEGMPCEIDKISELAKSKGIKVIEDCAQSLGALYNGRQAGSFGDAAYFSFAYGKQINTMGGGIVVTGDPELAQYLRQGSEDFGLPSDFRLFRKYCLQLAVNTGLAEPFFSLLIFPLILTSNYAFKDVIEAVFEDKGEIEKLPSYGERYSNFQAWLGIEGLETLEEDSAGRKAGAALYDKLLAPDIRRQRGPAGAVSSYCYYSIRSPERERVRRKLLARGIDTQSSWNRACSSLPFFAGDAARCPEADKLDKEVIYLPVYPALGERAVRRVCEAVNKALK